MRPRRILTRSRHMPRGTAAAALVASLTLLTAGCATGFNAQTNQRYNAEMGAETSEGDVLVRNAQFVNNPGETATLSATLLDGPEGPGGDGDILTGVSVSSDDGSIDVELSGPVEFTEFEPVLLGSEEPEVVISGDALVPGQMLRTTFTFQQAGTVQTNVPLVDRSAQNQQVAAPSILPTAGAEPTDEASAGPTDAG